MRNENQSVVSEIMWNVGVVLISCNQEWNIGRLIESVLKETASVYSREIVLVDSASSDRTVDIACEYPIKVLRLRPNQHLTSHAGRYVGYKHSSGDLMLFLDGDMELYSGWLKKAIVYMKHRPDVAGVSGRWIDLPKAAKASDKDKYEQRQVECVDKDVSMFGGAAMYRRSVLEQVGPFNPWLYSDGEPELCLRIRHAGYRIVELGHPIAYHYSDPPGCISTYVGRWKRKLYLGAGQNLRYHLGERLFWPYLRERGYGIVPLLALIVGLISLLWSLWSGQLAWLGIWVAVIVVILVMDAYRKQSLYRTIVSLLERALILDGTIRGFLMRPLHPDSYVAVVDVIKSVHPDPKHALELQGGGSAL